LSVALLVVEVVEALPVSEVKGLQVEGGGDVALGWQKLGWSASSCSFLYRAALSSALPWARLG
jgi:hypothetical protein